MPKYVVNAQDALGNMTMGELRTLGRVSGMTMEEAMALDKGDLSRLPMTTMIAITFILIRRQNPQFTEADMDGLDWSDIEFVQPQIGDDGTADPPVPLQPLNSGGRKSSARSVATTG